MGKKASGGPSGAFGKKGPANGQTAFGKGAGAGAFGKKANGLSAFQ